MAERRMFAKSIVLSDAFLDMPLSARCLYFTLGMLADDDGFVGNPKSIMRQCGASQDDMNVLLSKRFVLGFETGVIVIKHWRMNNYLRNDRYHTTTYLEEKELLTIDSKGAYTEKVKNTGVSEVGIPSGNQVVDKRYTEVRLGKDSIGKVNNIYPSSFDEFWEHYPRKQDKGQAYKCYQARLNDGYTEDQLLTACKNYAAECEKEKREKKYIKVGSTFLSVNEPFVEYLEERGNNEQSERRTTGSLTEDEMRAIIAYAETEEAKREDEELWADLRQV